MTGMIASYPNIALADETRAGQPFGVRSVLQWIIGAAARPQMARAKATDFAPARQAEYLADIW